MKFVLYFILPALCCAPFAYCSEIIIRPATINDLEALAAVSHNGYQNDFKNLYQQYYAQHIPQHQTIDEFVNECEQKNNDRNADVIKQQQTNKDRRLLVAQIKNLNEKSVLAGFCRFEKKSDTDMYINFILVHEKFRRQGLAKKLAYAAMKTWDTVTTCNFRALIHYNFINELYNKHNCIKTKEISLDPTGQISTNPDAPITHNEYSFVIKK